MGKLIPTFCSLAQNFCVGCSNFFAFSYELMIILIYQKLAGILIVIVLHLYINLKRTETFTILSLSIHQPNIYLFRSSWFFSISICGFYLTNSVHIFINLCLSFYNNCKSSFICCPSVTINTLNKVDALMFIFYVGNLLNWFLSSRSTLVDSLCFLYRQLYHLLIRTVLFLPFWSVLFVFSFSFHLLHWLEIPALCWIRVLKTDI